MSLFHGLLCYIYTFRSFSQLVKQEKNNDFNQCIITVEIILNEKDSSTHANIPENALPVAIRLLDDGR